MSSRAKRQTPNIKYYNAQSVGTFDDWESISGDKVQDVLVTGEGRPPVYEPDDPNHFIYLWSGAIPQKVVLVLNLDGSVVHSEAFDAPEYPAKRIIEFSSALDPLGNDWTIDNFNKTQGQTDNDNFTSEQSFKFYRQPHPIQEWNILSVGLRAVIQSGADLDQRQLRVLRLEKVLVYVD